MWVLYALWNTGTFVCMCMYVCVHMCVCLHVCSKYWDHFMVRFINCTFHLTYDLHFFKSINTSLHHQFKLLQIILFLKSMINWWTISHEFFFFIKSTAMIMFINKCVYFLTFTPWYLFTYVFLWSLLANPWFRGCMWKSWKACLAAGELPMLGHFR